MKSVLVFSICFLHIAQGLPQRIAGGSVASLEEYPFSASLITNAGSGNFLQACGGAILTNNAVLTAASCFYTDGVADPVSWWRVKVGSSYANRGGYIYLLREINGHPNYTPTSRDNDIAVVKTTLAMTLIQGVIEPVNIAGGAYQLNTNQEVLAIGWGATQLNGPLSEDLRHVQFWVVDQQTCANRYNEIGTTITSNMVCAGWLDVGIRGQCQGDTGSPLLQNGAVVGVFSFGDGCGQDYRPNINTRVSQYTSWIVSTATASF